MNFLEDSDKADMNAETLQTQYSNIKTLTTESHVMQYGDLTIANEFLKDFLSFGMFIESMSNGVKTSSQPIVWNTQVKQMDAQRATLMHMFDAETDEGRKDALLHEIDVFEASRLTAARQYEAIAKMVLPNINFGSLLSVHNSNIVNRDELRTMVEGVQRACGRFTDATRPMANVLNHLARFGAKAAEVVKAAEAVCSA